MKYAICPAILADQMSSETADMTSVDSTRVTRETTVVYAVPARNRMESRLATRKPRRRGKPDESGVECPASMVVT